MDDKLVVVTMHPEIEPYTAQTAEMAKESKVWDAAMKGLMKTPGTVEDKLAVMYAWGFIVGSSCAVEAVDLGLIRDSNEERGGMDDDSDGGDDSGVSGARP